MALPWPPRRTASGASGWRPRVKERGNAAHQQRGGAHGEAGGRRWGDACVRARQATAMADGRADARTEARMQRGRRGKELSSGIASSPGTRWSRRHGPGRTDGGGIAPASGGSGGGSRGRRRRTGRPRLDSVGEEEAEDVAELVTATASCGAAGGNGMVRRPADGAWAQFRFPVRESRGEVRRRAAGRKGGGLLVDAGREGGPGMARQGELHGGMARQCATVATGKGRRERRMTGGAHWSVV